MKKELARYEALQAAIRQRLIDGGVSPAEREFRHGAQKFGDAVIALQAYLAAEAKKATKKE